MENEKRLIYADDLLSLYNMSALYEAGEYGLGCIDIINDIKNAPTVDAEEVVHAKYDSEHCCTNCGETALETPYPGTYYHTLHCWACNAKMDNGFGIGDAND